MVIAMESERDAILRRRRELRAEYGRLYDRVSAILFEQDPGDVNFGDNTDEYESEADLIVPQLRSCSSRDDVQRVVVEVFRKMFDDETVASSARFQRAAALIWAELSSLAVTNR
jgi:hypothetical protein